MIRTLSAVALAATFGLSLSACRPGGETEAGERTTGVALGEPVPDIYDWRFLTHEGSAELNFGDEDFAEGISLFRLACAPRSRVVEVSWGYSGEAVLTSGTATGTFRAHEKAQSDHPVFTALRANGVLAVGLSGADMTLKSKPAGRDGLATFFDYCERGSELPVPVVPVPLEGAEGEEGATPPEPPVDPVEGEAVTEPTPPATTEAPSN